MLVGCIICNDHHLENCMKHYEIMTFCLIQNKVDIYKVQFPLEVVKCAVQMTTSNVIKFFKDG